MKKRLVTTVFACILSAACAFAFAACDDEPEGKTGEKVTEEEWIAAFENTFNATNFTFDLIMDDYIVNEENSNKIIQDKYTATHYFTEDAYYVYDCYDYYESSIVTKHGEGYFYLIEEGGNMIWVNSLDDGTLLVGCEAADSDDFDDYIYYSVKCDSSFLYMLEQFGESTYSEFSNFTYKDGEYTANFSFEGTTEKVTVKISNGYVIYFSMEEWYSNMYSSWYDNTAFTFSDFGTTEINVPEEVVKAINEYKENN